VRQVTQKRAEDGAREPARGIRKSLRRKTGLAWLDDEFVIAPGCDRRFAGRFFDI